MSHERRSTLLIYDGECRLCVVTKQRLEQAGVGATRPDIRFIPYQSDEAQQALGQQYRPGRPDMAFLVRPSGDVRYGLEAFLPFVPALPGGRLFLHLLRLPCGTPIASWVYRVVARYRYQLFGTVRRPQGHSGK